MTQWHERGLGAPVQQRVLHLRRHNRHMRIQESAHPGRAGINDANVAHKPFVPQACQLLPCGHEARGVLCPPTVDRPPSAGARALALAWALMHARRTGRLCYVPVQVNQVEAVDVQAIQRPLQCEAEVRRVDAAKDAFVGHDLGVDLKRRDAARCFFCATERADALACTARVHRRSQIRSVLSQTRVSTHSSLGHTYAALPHAPRVSSTPGVMSAQSTADMPASM